MTAAVEAATGKDLYKIIWTTFSRSQVLAGHSTGMWITGSLWDLKFKKQG